MKVYRATLKNPIVFPESVIITAENLNSIDFDRVIYCEVSPIGAMGNEGGILIYVLNDEDNLITYETNVLIDQQSHDAVLERIGQNASLFVNYSGGAGNYVYVKKDVQLEIDEKYNCFWYHSQKTKLRINSSVQGVFLSLVAHMNKTMETKKKILMFEDDQCLTEMYSDKLRKTGFDVKTYGDFPDDLAGEVVKEKPDIILMSILMPDMDGWEATKILKADFRTENIPIFGFSNMGLKENIEHAISLGMFDYFVLMKNPPSKIAEILNGYFNNPEEYNHVWKQQISDTDE